MKSFQWVQSVSFCPLDPLGSDSLSSSRFFLYKNETLSVQGILLIKDTSELALSTGQLGCAFSIRKMEERKSGTHMDVSLSLFTFSSAKNFK